MSIAMSAETTTSAAVVATEDECCHRSGPRLVYENNRTRLFLLPPPNDFSLIRPVAMKVLNNDLPTPTQIRRFYNEFEVCRVLDGLPGVRGALGRERGEGHSHTLYLPWIEGVTVKELFTGDDDRLTDEGEGRLGVVQTSAIVPPARLERDDVDLLDFLLVAAGAARVLGSIHSHGIIHRDVSSYNILVNLDELEKRRRGPIVEEEKNEDDDDDNDDESVDHATVLAAAAAFGGVGFSRSQTGGKKTQERRPSAIRGGKNGGAADGRSRKRRKEAEGVLCRRDFSFSGLLQLNKANGSRETAVDASSIEMRNHAPKRRRMNFGMFKVGEGNDDVGSEDGAGPVSMVAVPIAMKSSSEKIWEGSGGDSNGGGDSPAKPSLYPSEEDLVTFIDFGISCRAEDAASATGSATSQQKGSIEHDDAAGTERNASMPTDRWGKDASNPSSGVGGGGMVLQGNVQYISPEQTGRTNRAEVDHRSDLYSLGVVFYEMLVSALCPATFRHSLSCLVAGVGIPLIHLFLRALSFCLDHL